MAFLMLKTLSKTLLAISCFAIVGCTTTNRLGQFTAASSNNVRNLQYDLSGKTKVRTKGETCVKSVFGFTWGRTADRLQIAMDEAIKTGQDKGIDGDLLVNVRIENEAFSLGFYSSNCVTVAGDLVKIKIQNTRSAVLDSSKTKPGL
jgi:hypothetical protein